MLGSVLALAFLSPLGAPEEFKQDFPKHLTSLTMVRLPEGTAKFQNETKPVRNLYISKTEVPFDVYMIWALMMDLNNPAPGIQSRPTKPYAVIFSGFGQQGFPIICVSYTSAQEFCKWLSRTTGRNYRLPTAAEWHYAAGKAPDNLGRHAWYWDNSDDTTHRIGKKTPNEFGLHDMLGNAAEWVTLPNGKGAIMGGSWRDKAPNVTPSSLVLETPRWNEADPQNPKSIWWLANGQFIGLRVVCEGR